MTEKRNGKITINSYKSKENKTYYVTHLNGNCYFVIIKDITKLKKCFNVNRNIEYLLYNGDYEVINDLVIIR